MPRSLGCNIGMGEVRLNPPMETTIQSGDRAVAIAPSGLPFPLLSPVDCAIDADALRDITPSTQPVERLLILGWNRRGPLILEQLGHYLPPHSQVLVVAPVEADQMRADVASQSPRMQVTFESGNPIDRPTLERLAAAEYQFIVILSPGGAPDLQVADASAMVSLLHLRDIARQTGRAFSIVSEILDVQNRDLAEVTSADDVIISEQLIAQALAQLAENKDIGAVFLSY